MQHKFVRTLKLLGYKSLGLTKIDLSAQDIDDQQAHQLAAALQDNNTVILLNLNQNKMSYIGLTAITKVLRGKSCLRLLYLHSNNIDDQGAEAIANLLTHNTSLKELIIWQNNITDHGITLITQALQNNRSLHNLAISNNHITDKGAYNIIELLKINYHLTAIDLMFNKINDTQCLITIAENLKRNQDLKKQNLREIKIAARLLATMCRDRNSLFHRYEFPVELAKVIACHSTMVSPPIYQQSEAIEIVANNFKTLN